MTCRLFVDMDGVLVDFERAMRETGMSGNQLKRAPQAYLNMHPMPGAIEAVRLLISWGYDVWIATKPPTGVAQAYADKAQWIMNYLPELTNRIIITHDKGLLGDSADILIDDRPYKANCAMFKGELIYYRDEFAWPEILGKFTPHPIKSLAI